MARRPPGPKGDDGVLAHRPGRPRRGHAAVRRDPADLPDPRRRRCGATCRASWLTGCDTGPPGTACPRPGWCCWPGPPWWRDSGAANAARSASCSTPARGTRGRGGGVRDDAAAGRSASTVDRCRSGGRTGSTRSRRLFAHAHLPRAERNEASGRPADRRPVRLVVRSATAVGEAPLGCRRPRSRSPWRCGATRSLPTTTTTIVADDLAGRLLDCVVVALTALTGGAGQLGRDQPARRRAAARRCSRHNATARRTRTTGACTSSSRRRPSVRPSTSRWSTKDGR